MKLLLLLMLAHNPGVRSDSQRMAWACSRVELRSTLENMVLGQFSVSMGLEPLNRTLGLF